jgi:palmitoyltransferase
MQNWVNSFTDEKFTALHFASYHGNFDLIKLMVDEMGANVHVINVYGATCLHIAAQGDQPISLFYFAMHQNLDIN